MESSFRTLPRINEIINFPLMTFRSSSAIFLTVISLGCSSPTSDDLEQVDLKALLPAVLIAPSGESISHEILQGKYVGFYFSASWCPPCRIFTPKLIGFRNEHSDQFEVVLVGSDRSKEEQQAYVTEHGMPWPSLPNNGEHAKKLNELFGVQSIPTLIVVSPEGKVVSTRGREDITNPGSTALDEWLAKTKGS